MNAQELKVDPLGPRCTGISDDDIDQMARDALFKLPPLQAGPKRFVAWLAPFRREGVIETAWDYNPNSCEAVMIHDRTGSDIPKGTRIMVHPNEGLEREIEGELIGFFKAEDLIFIVTE